mgnify:CR=1 FL=1
MWHNEEVERLRTVRDQYHNRALITNDPEDWSKYRKCKNKATSLSRTAKSQYFQDALIESKGDSKGTWRILKQLLPKCISGGITWLNINETLVSDFSEIANSFNNFFVTIGENLAKKIPAMNTSAIFYLQKYLPRVNSRFYFTPVTSEEVVKLISGWSDCKSTGLDNYQSRLLKLAGPVIAPSLSTVMNKSLSTGQVPKGLEISSNYSNS